LRRRQHGKRYAQIAFLRTPVVPAAIERIAESAYYGGVVKFPECGPYEAKYLSVTLTVHTRGHCPKCPMCQAAGAK